MEEVSGRVEFKSVEFEGFCGEQERKNNEGRTGMNQ